MLMFVRPCRGVKDWVEDLQLKYAVQLDCAVQHVGKDCLYRQNGQIVRRSFISTLPPLVVGIVGNARIVME